jgi:hypothetical protein
MVVAAEERGRRVRDRERKWLHTCWLGALILVPMQLRFGHHAEQLLAWFHRMCSYPAAQAGAIEVEVMQAQLKAAQAQLADEKELVTRHRLSADLLAQLSDKVGGTCREGCSSR